MTVSGEPLKYHGMIILKKQRNGGNHQEKYAHNMVKLHNVVQSRKTCIQNSLPLEHVSQQDEEAMG